MKYILCYGDSNTWGASPDQLPRYEFEERWPGIVQKTLGQGVHIYENGLCGRTTGFTDDVEAGRNGKTGFNHIMEIYAPVDLVVIMLGSNDCKVRFSSHPAWDSALNMSQLAREAEKPCYGRAQTGSGPKILLVAPAALDTKWEKSWVGHEFNAASSDKSKELAGFYKQMAEENGWYFLDASEYAEVGVDCVHLTKASHAALGNMVTEKIREILQF